MPAIRWLRRDDVLPSLVRSHGHEAAPGVEAISASPQSWLAPPRPAEDRRPAFGAPGVPHRPPRRHERAFRASSIATAATCVEGNPRATAGSQMALVMPRQGKRNRRADNHSAPTRPCETQDQPGKRKAPPAIVPEDPSPALARRRAVHLTHSPETGSTGETRLQRAHGATAPRGGTRERNNSGRRIASAVCTGTS
jgi:hypothetical protein